MRLLSWLLTSTLGRFFAIVIVTVIALIIAESVFNGALGPIAAFVTYMVLFFGVYKLFGPDNRTLIPDEQRRNMRIVSIGAPILIGAVGILAAPMSAASQIWAAIFFLSPAFFFLYIHTKTPPFKMFDVWQADVPFDEKDDSKMRPVVTIGISTLGHNNQIECLYVTSKDKDFDQNFRGISPRDWDLGPVETRLHRSWVRINSSVNLSPSSFNRRLGTIDDQDIPKLERALAENHILPENPKYAID